MNVSTIFTAILITFAYIVLTAHFTTSLIPQNVREMPFYKPSWYILHFATTSLPSVELTYELSRQFLLKLFDRIPYTAKLSRGKTFAAVHKTHQAVYGKTFEGENFRGFLANRESFPLESFAVYSSA